MMKQNVHKKLPRLYIDSSIDEGENISLSVEHAHYLRNVLRKKEGDQIRVFNGHNGEWLCSITEIGKKSGILVANEHLRKQQEGSKSATLLFAPIKKNRMDFLIEKAVELGATKIQAVITQNTEIRKINEERIKTQIIEAAEQCERLDIPETLPTISLEHAIQKHSVILAALERAESAPHIKNIERTEDVAVLIGPEGGFTKEESEMLAKQPHIQPVSLGERILRAETAALYALTYINS